MEDTDWTPPVVDLEVADPERNVERYIQWSSSIVEEQLRVISYEATKLSRDRDVSQVRFVTVMGYDEMRTTSEQLLHIFTDFGLIRSILMGKRSVEIEYEYAASAHEAVATDTVDLYGNRLLVIFSESHAMNCPVITVHP